MIDLLQTLAILGMLIGMWSMSEDKRVLRDRFIDLQGSMSNLIKKINDKL